MRILKTLVVCVLAINLTIACSTRSDLLIFTQFYKVPIQSGSIKPVHSSKIAYIETIHQNEESLYTLWTANVNGLNKKILLQSSYPILSPTWSPDGGYLAYSILYGGGGQQIFVHNISSGKKLEIPIIILGLQGSPAWSTDGAHLAISIVSNGKSDIYRFNLANFSLKQLTRDYSINTESTWTPDGKWVFFTSDRSGHPQIYKVPSNGGTVTQVTYNGEANTSPTISPNGRYLAMIHKLNGRYKLAMMEINTSTVRILNQEGILDGSPSFSPNGSMLVFSSSKDGRRGIAKISFDGTAIEFIVTGNTQTPVWSPFLM